jgi:hypothetical protein
VSGPAVFLFVFVFIIIVGVAFFLHAQSIYEANEVFSRLARKFRGRCTAARFFQRPEVRFAYKGHQVLVDVHSTGGKHPTYYTQLHISWPDSSLRVEVRPEGFFSQMGKFLGMEDIEIGSPEFDQQYIITGNDPDAIRQLLNSEVQACTNQLRSFLGNDDIYISVRGGRLLIKKRSYIRQYPMLERFTLRSLELFDRALLTSMEGIEFVEDRGDIGWKEAMCQICGEEIQDGAVLCVSCKTPHHRDCWDYYGGCSTYGCGGRRCVAARKKRA